MKLQSFVLLAYCFTERNRTYAQTINEASLPQEGYKDRTMSERTVNRWFKFFRWLCCKDWKRMRVKIGGKDFILEGDESMFGKLKYGRGYGIKRRRAWVFGMICRKTGKLFVYVCPKDKEGKYKRTKAALLPIILANVKPETMLYTDGWRAYRKLKNMGYEHKWINHEKHYAVQPTDPNDPVLHTNTIESLWRQIKRWLPQSGAYNLVEYLELYQWFHELKLAGRNPFWRLMELIAEHNTYENVNLSQETPEPDTDGVQYDEFNEEETDEDDSDEEESDDEEDGPEIEHYWYDCPFCQAIWLSEHERNAHVGVCGER